MSMINDRTALASQVISVVLTGALTFALLGGPIRCSPRRAQPA